MMNQHLFIGLGGSGLRTISQLSKKLAQEEPNVEYHCLYIDTDEETRASINQHEMLIPPSQYLYLGDTNPYKVYEQATKGKTPWGTRLLEWITPFDNTIPRYLLSDWAQANRMIGRTAIVQHHCEFYNAIERHISAFAASAMKFDEAAMPDIWVVSSCCGGTGSALTIDTLYLINQIVKQKGLYANVKLVLFMPKPYIDMNVGSQKYPLNAFAFMWELNAFEQANLDFKPDTFKHFSAFPWNFTSEGDEQADLFSMVIPVDMETDKGIKIPLHDLYPKTAEMIYYLVASIGAPYIENLLSSSLRVSRKSTAKLVKHTDTKFLWGTWMVPFGYKIIKKPNQELRDYLKIRAKLDILQYGIVGEKIVADENVREVAGKEFATKYILPYLCDFNNIIIGENSVQAELDDAFANLGCLPIDGLDINIINGFINNISNISVDLQPLRMKCYNVVCDSISKGVNETIASHGIRYTCDLLQLLDDFYLEELNSNVLRDMQINAECDASILLDKLHLFISQGITKKNASAVINTGKSYAEACKRSITYRVARDIIRALTEYPVGYLEVLRNGDEEHVGLYELMNLVSAKVNEVRKESDLLRKSFIETKNNIFTTYIPSLYDIAVDEQDNSWAEGSLFEELYYESILPYDKEIAKGPNGRKVPVRQTDGFTNINTYLNRLFSLNGYDVFVKLALSTPDIAKKSLETIISKDLSQIIDNAINASGTSVSSWLNMTLEEYVTLNRGCINMDVLDHPTLIPTLYPTKDVHTEPICTNLIYIGASRRLAQTLGYCEYDVRNRFVEDSRMTDQFLIMKMQVGLDFYSYKYFDMLQDMYYSYSNSVLAQNEGCHLHKEFRYLDLDKALESIKAPERINALRLFLNAIYLQKVVEVLKEKEEVTYREVMNQFNPFSAFFENQGILDMDDLMTSDCFFRECLIKEGRTLNMVITILPCYFGTLNLLEVDRMPTEFHLTDILTPKAFTDALINASKDGVMLLERLKNISVVEKTLFSDAVKDAYDRVKDEAKKRAFNPATDSHPTFATLLKSWIRLKNPEFELYLNEINLFLRKIAL